MRFINSITVALAFPVFLAFPVSAVAEIKALIVDGQNNHKWTETTPVLKKLLEDTGLFRVEVATTPPKGADLSGFRPKFGGYDVVISNYNGDPWSTATMDALMDFVRKGGGFVSYHAANNSFPESVEYNKMIGVGGWGDRTETAGPYLHWRDGAIFRDPSPGKAGNHGARLPFLMVLRDSKHPITKGLPSSWLHEADELYDRLRGPGENIRVLATAYADPANKGVGEHQLMLFTLSYGKGRVFHTTLGHDVPAMRSVDFMVTFQRGAEWAAKGKVTQKLPVDFPTAAKVSVR